LQQMSYHLHCTCMCSTTLSRTFTCKWPFRV
jgi:hypothetical protein